LLWWVTKDKKDAKWEIVKVACEIARLALPFVKAGEDRPRLAIEAAEAWADDPTEENLERVRRARHAAAAAAAADAAAAYAAAYAAAAAADARKEIHTKSLAIIRAKFDCPWREDK
jgi:hypothetical protein